MDRASKEFIREVDGLVKDRPGEFPAEFLELYETWRSDMQQRFCGNWCRDDLRGWFDHRYKSDHKPLGDAEIADLAEELERCFNPELGVNWDVIDSVMDDFMRGRQS